MRPRPIWPLHYWQRYRQGARVRRYQKGLRRLRPYVMSSKHLPVSRERLFLGLGFEWDGRHAQRLADLDRRDGLVYKEQSALHRWARVFEARHERNFIRPV